MAGLFQVFWGKRDRTFQPPEPLQGSDGQPLIITPEGKGDADLDKICTRPFAADLDGDGKLDIVAGNFRGTFALFRGEGQGKFAPKNTWLTGAGGTLQVDAHGDPCLVDWDRDGDLDLLSGSAGGGAFLFTNTGSKKQPKWGKRVTLLEPPKQARGAQFGDQHVKVPNADTRVWADDVNGDGKVDLLI